MEATTADDAATGDYGFEGENHVNVYGPYGLGDYRFDLIHISGLLCLSISIVISVSVICFLNYPFRQSIWSRPIGERLVVYLAVCDLLYSISHVLDHSYMLATRDHPPEVHCSIFAFFLNEFVLAQSLVVAFTAVNAFYMVVKQKKLGLGARDWRLLVVALGIPAMVGVVGCGTGQFGPGGMWCYINMHSDLGPLLTNIVAAIFIVTFFLNFASYAAVWFKIRQATINKTSTQSSKYVRTARIMMLFVAVYLAQWWAYVVYAAWTLVADDPHISIRVASVSFSNMGGVFNFIAYTLVRRKYQSVQSGEASTMQTAQHTRQTTT